MNDNNDFLKGYKNKAGSSNSAEPTKSTETSGTEMSYREKETFQKPANGYPSRNSYQADREYERKRRMKNTITVALTIFSITAVIITIIILTSGKITVPNFYGWKRNDFMLWAGENGVLSQIDEQYNDNVESDLVYSQNPAEGTKIKKGDFVKVVISKGPDPTIEFALPDLMNMTSTQIEQWAQENKMSKIRITGENSDTVPLGYVIEYEINDNTVIDKVKRDTPIYIVVSKGPEAVTQKDITIPDFRTMGVSETVIFAQENGLLLTIDKQYDDYIPANSIISQSAAKDSILHQGDSIRITVSLGRKVTMISFKQFSRDEAPSAASQLGITYSIEERYSSSSKGRLIWQSIEEGTEIKPDMHLELRYSLGSQIFIGNYVGSPKSSIEKWLLDENALGARATLNFTYTQNAADPGTIIQQSIADTFIYRDKTIDVVVSLGAIMYAPDFVAPAGSSYDKAITREKALDLVAGMDVTLVFVQENNPARLPGEVWYQSVAAGTEVKAGTTITLKYNPPGTTVDVPDFTGKTEAEVKLMAEYAKLTVTFVQGEYDINYAGKVYGQTIAKYTTVAQGMAITLYVSPAVEVTVPDFTGMTREEVENSSHYANFSIIFVSEFSGDAADAGKVFNQDVAAYTTVPKGTQITLKLGTAS